MSRLFSYIIFILKSKNEHSVHSPFVFNLLIKSLYKKKINKDTWTKYLTIKNKFLKSNETIVVNDFGASSKTLKSNKRKIKDIALKAGITNKRAIILANLSSYLKPKCILEIGTSIGLSSVVLSLSNPNSKIITLEGCVNTLNSANKSFKKNQLNNIYSIQGKFEDTIPNILNKYTFDFVFIDGNHTKKATIEYFHWLLKNITNNSCLVFDDIYWSKEMSEAWNYIYKHPKVSVSIDTYKWGIIFFKKELSKEHFVIRV